MKSSSHPMRVSPGSAGNVLLFPEGACASAGDPPEAVDQPPSRVALADLDAVAFARITAEWRSLLRGLGRRRRILESVLAAGRPLRLCQGALVIGFAADRQFHRALLDVPEHRRAVEEELARRFGIKLDVVTKLHPESRGRRPFDRTLA